MLYEYIAKNAKGGVYEGEFEAKGREDLYSHIRAEGGRIVSVKERGTGDFWETLTGLFGRVSYRDKILLAKNLGSMLSAGLSITRAIEVMERQARKRSLRELLHDLNQDVSRGKSLSESLKLRGRVFEPLFISMVRAGEESGNLADSLKVVALQMEKSFNLSKRVKGAMIYPCLILSLMVVISILLLIYMVPTLTATFNGLGIELPLATRIIIGASTFLITNTVIFVSLVALVMAATLAFLKSQAGERATDSIFLKLPVIGLIVREVNSARTARTLASLLSAGVPIVDALMVTEDVVANHRYKEALSQAREAIQKGEAVSTVLARYEEIYPPFISEMTAVGEETGKIAEMLLNVATYYEEDVDEKTKDLSTIIEPVLMIIIGAGVGVFAISMLAPTYSLVNNI